MNSDLSSTLTIGIKASPPFIIKKQDGGYTGLGVTLWKEIAEDLGLKFKFQEAKLDELIKGVSEHRFDLGMGALTITSEREKILDFSQPFYTSGLGIAVTPNDSYGWIAMIKQIFSTDFLSAVLALIIVLLISGLLIWLFERKSNAEQFGGASHKGIAAGFWWAAVTMTTVGYGDKSPQTLGGRLVGVIWMFTAVIIISSFTASIASSLTVGQLSVKVRGPQDLPSVRVGTVQDSSSADYLDNSGIGYQTFKELDDALDALGDNRVEAVVYDAPLLRYCTRQRHKSKMVVLPNTFERQEYAFALPEGSPLVEMINRKLLEITEKPTWKDTTRRFLGK